MEVFFSAVIAGLVALFVGSWVGDQRIFRECATKQEVKLMDETKIKCEVQRSHP